MQYMYCLYIHVGKILLLVDCRIRQLSGTLALMCAKIFGSFVEKKQSGPFYLDQAADCTVYM